MKKYLILVFVVFAFKGYSQDVNLFFDKADAFFKANVLNGKVAYSKIHKNQDGLNEIIHLAETISVSIDNPKVYQAFWINAYNVSVIKGIINNYPTKSPLDNAGFLIRQLII